jgi:hypothetical protein
MKDASDNKIKLIYSNRGDVAWNRNDPKNNGLWKAELNLENPDIAFLLDKLMNKRTLNYKEHAKLIEAIIKPNTVTSLHSTAFKPQKQGNCGLANKKPMHYAYLELSEPKVPGESKSAREARLLNQYKHFTTFLRQSEIDQLIENAKKCENKYSKKDEFQLNIDLLSAAIVKFANKSLPYNEKNRRFLKLLYDLNTQLTNAGLLQYVNLTIKRDYLEVGLKIYQQKYLDKKSEQPQQQRQPHQPVRQPQPRQPLQPQQPRPQPVHQPQQSPRQPVRQPQQPPRQPQPQPQQPLRQPQQPVPQHNLHVKTNANLTADNIKNKQIRNYILADINRVLVSLIHSQNQAAYLKAKQDYQSLINRISSYQKNLDTLTSEEISKAMVQLNQVFARTQQKYQPQQPPPVVKPAPVVPNKPIARTASKKNFLSDEQTLQAIEFFKNNPKAVKYSRKQSGLPYSVINTENGLYALYRSREIYQPKNKRGLLGAGTYGRVKLAQSLQDDSILTAL